VIAATSDELARVAAGDGRTHDRYFESHVPDTQLATSSRRRHPRAPVRSCAVVRHSNLGFIGFGSILTAKIDRLID